MIARLSRVIPSSIGAHTAAAVSLGIGDDAAVVRATRGREWVVSTDAFVEGSHFLTRLHPPHAAGFKALARAASDLAAMGAAPRYFLLTLALPAGRAGNWLDGFARGMALAAARLGLRLIGGDVSRHERVAAAVTVIGTARRGRVLSRSGARPGDVIFVSGRLGAAQTGLEILLREGARALAGHPESYSLERHLYPEPRLGLGQWLVSHGLASAAMDISDGLSTDLARLCAASGVGAIVHASLLPVASDERPGSRRAATIPEKNAALRRALHGGDDYELLFTVPRRLASRIPGRFRGLPISRIGEVVSRRRGVLLELADGRRQPLPPRGWEHFASRKPGR